MWRDVLFVNPWVTVGGTVIIYNIRDFQWDHDGSSSARQWLLHDITLAAADPFSYIVIVVGDFNRVRKGETRSYFGMTLLTN